MVDRARYALASKLFGSGVIAQVAGFAATAYAASRSTPAEFALFAAMMAATAVLGSVNSLAAESRIPVVSDVAAGRLGRAGFAAVVGSSLVCAVIGVAGVAVGQVWGEIALFTAWAAFMLGVQHLLIGIVLRTQRQVLLARNRLVQGLSNAALIVGLVLAGVPAFYALSLAWAISFTVSDLALLRHVRDWLHVFGWPQRGDLARLVREVRWQPVANVLSDGVAQVPLLALPALGSPGVSGAWAAASRFLMPVVNMTQVTLQPIYYGRAAHLLREGDVEGFEHHRRRWSLGLLIFAIPVVAGCYVALQWLIPLLGPEWDVARRAILPACIVFPMMVSWLPISQSLILGGRMRAQFVWTVVQFLIGVTPFALAAATLLTPAHALLFWAIGTAIGMSAHRFMQRATPLLATDAEDDESGHDALDGPRT